MLTQHYLSFFVISWGFVLFVRRYGWCCFLLTPNPNRNPRGDVAAYEGFISDKAYKPPPEIFNYLVTKLILKKQKADKPRPKHRR